MRQFLLFTLSFVLLLCGCSVTSEPTQVVASFYPMELLAKAVAGDALTVSSMAPQVQGCLHNYQLLPSDMKRLAGAEVCVLNGLGMESFEELVRQQAPQALLVSTGEAVTDGYVKDNSHAWMKLSSAYEQASAMEAAFAAKWPDKADAFSHNLAGFQQALVPLQREMSALHGQGVQAVCFHEGLALLAEEAGMEVLAVLSLDEETPSTHTLRLLMENIQKADKCIILTDKGGDAYAVQTMVIKETGAVECPLYTMTRRDGDMDYIAMMAYNISVLKEAIS